MTKAKIKREEYREIKEYWALRLLYKIPVPWGGYLWAWNSIKDGDFDCNGWPAPIFREYTNAQVRNGYAKDAPVLTEQIESITIGPGRPEWGAEPGKLYFVIKYKD